MPDDPGDDNLADTSQDPAPPPAVADPYSLLEAAFDLCLEVDRVGKLLRAGGRMLERLGRKGEELVGHRLSVLLAGEDLAELLPVFKAVFRAAQTQQVNCTLHVLGRSVDAELIVAPAGGQSAAPPRAVLLVRDLSEVAELRYRLGESEARYRGLMRSFHDLILTIDRAGRVRSVNARAAERYGGPVPDWEGRRFEDLLDAATARLFAARVNRVFKSGQPSRWEGAVTLFGKHHHFDVIWSPLIERDGRAVQVVAVCRDVTERQIAQQQLRQAERRYATLVDSVEDFIFVLDSKSRVLSVNRRLAEALGEAPGAFTGRELRAVLGPAAAEFAPRIESVFARAQTIEFEHRMEFAGRTRVLSVVFSPLKSADAVAAVVGVARDRTAQRDLEEAMYRTQKMETVGQLAGGVAHDFNNLLVGVLTNASFVRRQLAPGSELQGPLALIEKSAQQSAALIQQILAFAGRSNNQKQVVQLNPIVQDTLGVWQRQLPNKVQVTTRLSGHLPEIDADPSQINQVVMNLVLNAAEAMPAGGTLNVVTRLARAEELLAEGVEWTGGPMAVELAVNDQGIGMDAALREKIFEPYFTTKKDGRGLGLAAVYGIVRRHNGIIRVESEPGKGTRFRIFLRPTLTPTRREHEVAIPTDSALRRLPGGIDGVLVVTRDDRLAMQLETLLSLMGYNVYVASEAGELGEILDEFGAKIRVLLTDVDLRSDEPMLREIQRHREVEAGRKHMWVASVEAAEPARRGAAAGKAPKDVLAIPRRYVPEKLARELHEAIESPGAEAT